jgi:glycosyltransferase involved in cell wall biosynthesis
MSKDKGSIVFVTPYYPPFGAGGAEYTTSLHAGILARSGRRVTVVTPDYGASTAASPADAGVEVLRYPFGSLAGPGKQLSASTLYGFRHQTLLERFLREKLGGGTASCLHAQHSFSTVGTWRAAQAMGLPFIGHIRDTSMVCALGASCLVETGAQTPPPACGMGQHLQCAAASRRPFNSRLLGAVAGVRVAWPYRQFRARRHALEGGARIAFASQGLLEMHAGLAGFPERSRLRVVYAPALDAEKEPGALPPAVAALVAQSTPYLLYVGKVSRGKGLDVLFRAHQLALEHIPNLHLVIAGNIHGEEWQFDKARTLLLGYVRRHELPALYANCAVVAVPSTWPEPLGWATLDAGRYSRPIVATAVGGIPEAVIDGESGYLVPPLQPEAMARAFVTLLGDPQRAAKMARNNHRHVMSHFGIPAVAKQLESLYEGL